MKRQIERFSPHQNGKVFAVLTAAGSLVFLVPFMLFASAFGPKSGAPGLWVIVVLPMAYMAIGYVCAVLGCWLYNFMFRYIGGIEFEWRERDV